MKLILKAALLACLPTASFAEPVIVPSAGSVPETVQRLQASVEAAGAQVFGIIDFGSGVKSIGENIGDLQLVIFGDPRIGAPALAADPMSALALPAKVLVYDTGNGTAMAYEVPADMLAEWNIPSDAPVLEVMANTLDQITSAAAEQCEALTDYEWTAIEPFLPNKPRGVPRVNDRRVLNGIFWVLRSGAPWRDLPESFGPYTTCYNRFLPWRRAGVWGGILAALAATNDAAVQMIDTSIVRVHQHAACIIRNKDKLWADHAAV